MLPLWEHLINKGCRSLSNTATWRALVNIKVEHATTLKQCLCLWESLATATSLYFQTRLQGKEPGCRTSSKKEKWVEEQNNLLSPRTKVTVILPAVSKKGFLTTWGSLFEVMALAEWMGKSSALNRLQLDNAIWWERIFYFALYNIHFYYHTSPNL